METATLAVVVVDLRDGRQVGSRWSSAAARSRAGGRRPDDGRGDRRRALLLLHRASYFNST
jgi:hypothetical protein